MTRSPRLARGTTTQPTVTRSRLVLALREAEARADRKMAADLRVMLGDLAEVNTLADAAARQLDGKP